MNMSRWQRLRKPQEIFGNYLAYGCPEWGAEDMRDKNEAPLQHCFIPLSLYTLGEKPTLAVAYGKRKNLSHPLG